MTYTLAIVDEGLLDITSFKTPDVWGHFHKKEALGVRSYDMYHAVLGAFDGKMANIFAIGGSDDAMKALDKGNMNRFKPVVKFMGPLPLAKGKRKLGRTPAKLNQRGLRGYIYGPEIICCG